MPKKKSGKAVAPKTATKTDTRLTVNKTVKGMEKRLALMGYVRGKDWSTELIHHLQSIEQALEECSLVLKALPEQSTEEAAIIERLQALEIQRFQLLGQLHGNRVNDYHTLIS